METIVSKEVVNLDELFPGVESNDVLTKVPNILKGAGDMSFMNDPGNTNGAEAESVIVTTPAEGAAGAEKPEGGAAASAATPKPVNQSEADKLLNSLTAPDTETEETPEEAAAADGKGRPKTDKSALTSYLKNKIETKEFEAFEDFDEKKESLDEYLAKQPEKVLHQLLDANWGAKEKELLERTPVEFFEALPEELRYAARYAMEGGKDMKTLFAALAKVEQVKALDITTEDGQLAAARAYLEATGFGRGKPQVIEKQVAEWKESGKLEEKVKEFKPDLDEMQKEQVEYQIQQQQDWNKQQKAAASAYIGNVHKALEKADINGIKLDKKTQAALYDGLTNVNYTSASGKPTNLLGHLLDEIQYTKPNFELLAEVTYLLSNPEAYRNSIKQQGKNETVTDVTRKLKSEQMNNNTSTASVEDDEDDKPKTRRLSKPKNIFEK